VSCYKQKSELLRLCDNNNQRSERKLSPNEVFTDCQPQYPDLQAHFKPVFISVQTPFETIRYAPALTRRTHGFYSLIEEIVEGFVEDFGERKRLKQEGWFAH
jgi:hypothetical protein